MIFLEDNDLLQDKRAYHLFWENIILPEIGAYQTDFDRKSGALKNLDLVLELVPNIKEMIWDKYCFYNIKCKSEYMEPPKDGTPFLLDRHKVAACYMAAIVSTQPMSLYSFNTNEPVSYPINELLAITTGLSILLAFLKVENLPKNEIMNCQNGILYPPSKMVSHGDYINNFANELHFSLLDGSINLLSISHELFLLEVITRLGVGECSS